MPASGICFPPWVLPERRAELERIAALAERLDGSLARLRAEKPALTPREREIYELIKSGTTSHKAIARRAVHFGPHGQKPAQPDL